MARDSKEDREYLDGFHKYACGQLWEVADFWLKQCLVSDNDCINLTDQLTAAQKDINDLKQRIEEINQDDRDRARERDLLE